MLSCLSHCWNRNIKEKIDFNIELVDGNELQSSSITSQSKSWMIRYICLNQPRNLYNIVFLVTLVRVSFFICSLPYGSWFNPVWNLSLLLRLNWIPVFNQVLLHVLDYKWSHNSSTFWRTVTHNRYWTRTILKFCLQYRWITGACYYTRPNLWSNLSSEATVLCGIKLWSYFWLFR